MTDPATHKQISYIIDLGGDVPENLTKSEASRLIQQLLDDKSRRKQTKSTPSTNDILNSCLGLIMFIGLIYGVVYLFDSNTNSDSNDNNESDDIVYISRYGECYHYYDDCIALDNINAYVEVFKWSLSSATNSHRLCEICRQNAGL